jgi:hypothetical protein
MNCIVCGELLLDWYCHCGECDKYCEECSDDPLN